MPINPSAWTNKEFDPLNPIRQFCTCPHCLLVWTHQETFNHKHDWIWAHDHYDGPIQCPECDTISEMIPVKDLRFRDRIRGNVRRAIAPDRAQGVQRPPQARSASEPNFREEREP